jgi:hypothetical protein
MGKLPLFLLSFRDAAKAADPETILRSTGVMDTRFAA